MSVWAPQALSKRPVMATWTAVAQRCILDGERGAFRGEGDERISTGGD